MQTILFNILLLLIAVWVFIGILFLWQQFRIACHRLEKACEKKNEQEQKQSTLSVTQDQIEQARQMLVGKSKSYRERYAEISKEITTNSQNIPAIPDTSSKEKPADNPNTFAAENSSMPEETEGTEEDNELQVDYTMDEPEEDSIVREELQIADAALPEVSPSAILAREVVRITGWHKNDDALDEENETEVHETLQAIQGTQLMDYIKEATLKQEKDHQRLLAAIRKAEEAELEESNISSSPDSETDSNVESYNSEDSEDDERPLSYYL
ncbi:hypothetical protein [Prevotella denticola]|uniref:hypothetical protein n=1 Tax=Prevotella denticola TaxID=28129 RepID=UPI000E592D53|nr:hypothetical protein [Prevotella denticola]AXV49746.1 hypothetical protein DYJ25_07715 [Prevotella denticola]